MSSESWPPSRSSRRSWENDETIGLTSSYQGISDEPAAPEPRFPLSRDTWAGAPCAFPRQKSGHPARAASPCGPSPASLPPGPRYNERTKPPCFAVLPPVPRRPEAQNNGVGSLGCLNETSSISVHPPVFPPVLRFPITLAFSTSSGGRKRNSDRLGGHHPGFNRETCVWNVKIVT